MPESARWLMSQGKLDKAEKILQTTARINGTKIDRATIEKVELQDTSVSYTLIDVLKKWTYAKVALNIWFNWYVHNLPLLLFNLC